MFTSKRDTGTCRYCTVAVLILDKIPESDCPPGLARDIVVLSSSWHRRCRRPCPCTHDIPEGLCDGELLLPLRAVHPGLHRHQAVQEMHGELEGDAPRVVPHFGFTSHGHPVHQKAFDYHQAGTAYQRFNKKLALTVTRKVGTMTCAYIFSAIALISLPAILTQAFHLHAFPSWLIAAGLIALVSWVAQTYIQLVLLSVIMVGQDVAAQASDARSAKTFEDTEKILATLEAMKNAHPESD